MSLLKLPSYGNEIILTTPKRNEILQKGPPLNGKYNILGRGAYGTVFKAVYQAQQVAVKVLRNTKDINMQTIQNEANILGWNHRNIVKILKVESTPNFGIVIMERINGQCLQSILENISLPLKHQIYITLDILSALSHCHKHQLLHLDIKPQNVLVCFKSSANENEKENCKTKKPYRNYICKLCDFGASKQLKESENSFLKSIVKGTVRYMSPEALREEPLTPAADIYSLGITMWQLQQRRLPYYWLACNEMVAYRVVKQQLRPDSGTKRLMPGANQQYEKCYCVSLGDEEITYHSLEYIKKAVNSNKPKEEQLHFAASVDVNRRRPFGSLNSKLNVMRDLGKEWNFENDYKEFRLKGDKKVIENVDLQGMFKNTGGREEYKKKITYENLYKSCWQHDPKLRPDTKELRRRLGELL